MFLPKLPYLIIPSEFVRMPLPSLGDIADNVDVEERDLLPSLSITVSTCADEQKDVTYLFAVHHLDNVVVRVYLMYGISGRNLLWFEVEDGDEAEDGVPHIVHATLRVPDVA